MELEFPFVVLNDREKVFRTIPNYEELVLACPANIGREWQKAAMILHFQGWTEARQNKTMELLKTDNSGIARAQVEYLTTWLGCYRSSHEEKVKIGGWLLSLMLGECPVW